MAVVETDVGQLHAASIILGHCTYVGVVHCARPVIVICLVAAFDLHGGMSLSRTTLEAHVARAAVALRQLLL